MADLGALRTAIDLLHMPSRLRIVKEAPLPRGIDLVLKIAAGDREAESEAARLTERQPETLREASRFFIEQILLATDSDSYRTLGAAPDATTADLRRNMALLVKAMHPDVDTRAEHAAFIGRVNRAWDTLKTQERREAYDRARPAKAAGPSPAAQGHRASSSRGMQGAGPRRGPPPHMRRVPLGRSARALHLIQRMLSRLLYRH
jgi:DnaJ domain